MTGGVREGIEHGRFADPHWMGRYLVTFANYYPRAFFAVEPGLGRFPIPGGFDLDVISDCGHERIDEVA